MIYQGRLLKKSLVTLNSGGDESCETLNSGAIPEPLPPLLKHKAGEPLTPDELNERRIAARARWIKNGATRASLFAPIRESFPSVGSVITPKDAVKYMRRWGRTNRTERALYLSPDMKEVQGRGIGSKNEVAVGDVSALSDNHVLLHNHPSKNPLSLDDAKLLSDPHYNAGKVMAADVKGNVSSISLKTNKDAAFKEALRVGYLLNAVVNRRQATAYVTGNKPDYTNINASQHGMLQALKDKGVMNYSTTGNWSKPSERFGRKIVEIANRVTAEDAVRMNFKRSGRVVIEQKAIERLAATLRSAGLFKHISGAPLSEAEHDQRVAAGQASARSKHAHKVKTASYITVGSLIGARAGFRGGVKFFNHKVESAKTTEPPFDQNAVNAQNLSRTYVEGGKLKANHRLAIRINDIKKPFTKPAEDDKLMNLSPVATRIRQLRTKISSNPAEAALLRAKLAEHERSFEEGRPQTMTASEERAARLKLKDLSSSISQDEHDFLLNARPSRRVPRTGYIATRRTEEGDRIIRERFAQGSKGQRDLPKPNVIPVDNSNVVRMPEATPIKPNIRGAVIKHIIMLRVKSELDSEAGATDASAIATKNRIIELENSLNDKERDALAGKIPIPEEEKEASSYIRQLRQGRRSKKIKVKFNKKTWKVPPTKIRIPSDISAKGMARLRGLLVSEAKKQNSFDRIAEEAKRPQYYEQAKRDLIDQFRGEAVLRALRSRSKIISAGIGLGVGAGALGGYLTSKVSSKKVDNLPITSFSTNKMGKNAGVYPDLLTKAGPNNETRDKRGRWIAGGVGAAALGSFISIPVAAELNRKTRVNHYKKYKAKLKAVKGQKIYYRGTHLIPIKNLKPRKNGGFGAAYITPHRSLASKFGAHINRFVADKDTAFHHIDDIKAQKVTLANARSDAGFISDKEYNLLNLKITKNKIKGALKQGQYSVGLGGFALNWNVSQKGIETAKKLGIDVIEAPERRRKDAYAVINPDKFKHLGSASTITHDDFPRMYGNMSRTVMRTLPKVARILKKDASNASSTNNTAHDLQTIGLNAEDAISQRLARIFREWKDNAASTLLHGGSGQLARDIKAGAVDAMAPLAEAFKLGGKTPIQTDNPKYAVAASFALRNPLLEDYVEKFRSSKIQGLTDEAIDNIKTVLVEAAKTGMGPDQMARAIRQTIGLTPGQSASVLRYRWELENLNQNALERELRDKRFDRSISKAITNKKNLAPDLVDAMVDAYHRKYLAYRAMTIARTEGVGAANNGHMATIQELLDQNPELEVVKTWVATLDDRTRPDHRALHGKSVVGFNSSFVAPSGDHIRWPGDPLANGRNVINCRCTINTKLVRRGSNV